MFEVIIIFTSVPESVVVETVKREESDSKKVNPVIVSPFKVNFPAVDCATLEAPPFAIETAVIDPFGTILEVQVVPATKAGCVAVTAQVKKLSAEFENPVGIAILRLTVRLVSVVTSANFPHEKPESVLV